MAVRSGNKIKYMTTFKEFSYVRPDLKVFKGKFENLLTEFKAAESVAIQCELISEINVLRNDFDTMWNLAHIRHTIDTKNEFYEKENNFFDESVPEFQELVDKFYSAIVNSKFKSELMEKFGKQFFTIAEMNVKTFDPIIMEDLKEENRLKSEYVKLSSSAIIEFQGKEYNLSGITPFTLSDDREIRKESTNAYWGFFAKNREKFDEIYDKLVKVRTRIAQKLGYKNYIELGYLRMQRSDYNFETIAKFRDMIHKHIVPMVTKLKGRQAKRLDLDSLKHYDNRYQFKTGNAKPKGNPDWIVENGKAMYEQLSPETGTFFNFMLKKNLLDLVNKKGKAGGGYCTYIANEKAPFIFSNFNGTSHDIDVLTHEAGHAFQVFESRNYEIPEYQWPTCEACEIHSMSMEFLTWPWMDSFFKEDVEKYKFSHLSGALLFLPYGASVDEFQHEVYENPDMTPAERRAAWRKIEMKYMPGLDYDGNEYLEGGGMWQKQAHIFEMPFYYIDYTLAQICAFQFWKKSQDGEKETFNDYLRLCRAGGSRPFLELVDYANLKSPFKEESLQSVLSDVEGYLETVDDMAL